MKNKRSLSFIAFASTFVLFGTVGLFRRTIALGSATVAVARGLLGGVTILLLMLLTRKKPDFAALRRNLWLLIASGAAIGVNWVLLFEAYNRTTVAIATLCYYTAPIFAIVGAPIFFREKLTLRSIGCVSLAALGMVGVSGVIGGAPAGGSAGILLGLGAAVFYAAVMLLNRPITGLDAFTKTAVQLFVASLVALPYALIKEPLPAGGVDARSIVFLLILGIVHTGLAYSVYFGTMNLFPVATVSLCGYVDPAVAVILSVTVLSEPITPTVVVGIVLILGATVLHEIGKKPSK